MFASIIPILGDTSMNVTHELFDISSIVEKPHAHYLECPRDSRFLHVIRYSYVNSVTRRLVRRDRRLANHGKKVRIAHLRKVALDMFHNLGRLPEAPVEDHADGLQLVGGPDVGVQEDFLEFIDGLFGESGQAFERLVLEDGFELARHELSGVLRGEDLGDVAFADPETRGDFASRYALKMKNSDKPVVGSLAFVDVSRDAAEGCLNDFGLGERGCTRGSDVIDCVRRRSRPVAGRRYRV